MNTPDQNSQSGVKKHVLGVVTPWNIPCGIATYSTYLLQYFFNSPNYAVHVFACDNKTPIDEPFVQRCWSRKSKNYDELIISIIKARCDSVIIQHETAFTTFSDLVYIITSLDEHEIKSILELHNCNGSDLHCLAHLPASCLVLVHNEQNEKKMRAIHSNVCCFRHGSFQRTPLAKEEARAKHGIQGAPVIGVFGFLNPRKNFGKVLDAFDILKKTHPDAFLLILTFVHLERRHSRRLKENFTQRINGSPYPESIRFCTEFLEEDLIHELLDCVDVTVFPYPETHGGGACSGAVRFPLASNSLVACSYCPMFDDIRDVVHSYTPNTPEGIAAATLELINNAELRDRLHTEKKKAIDRTSWDACSREIEGFLQQLRLPSSAEAQQ